MAHGRAVDEAVEAWVGTGKLPHRADPCAITAIRAIQSAGITPIQAQFKVFDAAARVATAVDMLRTDADGSPLLLELKSTQIKTAFFAKKGEMRQLSGIAYRCAHPPPLFR